MLDGFPFRPKILDTFKNYSRQDFIRDLIAGLAVGIVALPLAMAFGIASGVDPKAGIFTAIIAGFIISVFSGSKVQIGGPTGAFVAIVYGVIAVYGVDNLILCTLMAGVILLVMGFTRMGTMIKYIPYPVTTGFTCGIAVLIFSTQIKDFFGLHIDKMPSDFVDKIKTVIEAFQTKGINAMDWHGFALAAASLAVILLWPARFSRRIPGTIIALVVGTAAVMIFGLEETWHIPTIGSVFHGIPSGLPPFHFPQVAFHDLQALVSPAVTIALLAAIESLLCAVVADGMIDDRHDSNMELIAQGLGNIGSGLFGGIPATGAIARTATNVKNGGRSPVAGIVHALVLLTIVLVAGPLASHIPLATLSAVMVMVAYNMGEWRILTELRRWPKSDSAVFLTAFGMTVFIDLVAAVKWGMVMAAFLFMKRISETTQITAVDERSDEEGSEHSMEGKHVPDQVMIYRIFGAFFFGAADKLETALKRMKQEPEILILHMRRVLAMDATGLNALENLHRKLRARDRYIILSGPHTQPLIMMEKAGMLDSIGRENMCEDIDSALVRAKEILAQKKAAKGLPAAKQTQPAKV